MRRSRLLEALDRGRRARLTLVVGSPGAGKTALLADWLAAHPERPAAWLSCDPADAAGAGLWLPSSKPCDGPLIGRNWERTPANF